MSINLNIKSLIIVLLNVFSFQYSYSQTISKEALNQWKNPGIERFDNYSQITNLFPSSKFLGKEFNGILGKKKQIFTMHINTIDKVNNYNGLYLVTGKINIENCLANFQGEFLVERVETYDIQDSLIKMMGVGDFKLNTDSISKTHINGVFKYYYNYNFITKKVTCVDYKQGFAGEITDSIKNKHYRCLFGFKKYPKILEQQITEYNSIKGTAWKEILKWKDLNEPIIFPNNIDFSTTFYYENCSYMGIFGNNHHKINLRFDEVRKVNTNNYFIKGRSLLKAKQCNFKGTISIDRIESIDIVKDTRTSDHNMSLFLVGKYQFSEEDNCEGEFTGVFRKFISYTTKTKALFSIDESDSYNDLSGFAGYWNDKKNGAIYNCHFGFQRYPEVLATDFDMFGGEASINPKYKKYGWESYYINPDLGYYMPLDCSDNWWEK